jgi:hypothetical protein
VLLLKAVLLLPFFVSLFTLLNLLTRPHVHDDVLHCVEKDQLWTRKEEAKVLAMRQRCQERSIKFLDSKQRTIGIDRNALDEQVEEHKRHIEQEKEEELQQG